MAIRPTYEKVQHEKPRQNQDDYRIGDYSKSFGRYPKN